MVIWSDPAKEDLKKIYDYIAGDSKYYAIKVSQEFIEKSEQLVELPKMGRIFLSYILPFDYTQGKLPVLRTMF